MFRKISEVRYHSFCNAELYFDCYDDEHYALRGGLGITRIWDCVRLRLLSVSMPTPTTTTGVAVDCVCGSSVDDEFSIACDNWGRWCHRVCFGVSKEDIIDLWPC